MTWGRTSSHESRPWRGPLWFHDELSGRDLSFPPGRHLFIAGQTGSGKSRLMDELLYHLAYGPVEDGTAVIYGIDLKDGIEFSKWQGRMAGLAVDLEQAAGLLERVDLLRVERNETLRGRGLEKATPDQGFPWVYVFVDEAAELSGGVGREERQLQERAQRALGRLLRMGRSAGVTVVAASQDPRKEALPLRDRFPERIALSLVNKTEALLMMGEDAVRDGCAPHAIPLSRPGTGYWYDREQRRAVRFRTRM